MESVLTIVLNGEPKDVPGVTAGAALTAVVEALGLKPDRIAVERNGEIVRRAAWGSVTVADGDRLEIVHFVGGGCNNGKGVSAAREA